MLRALLWILAVVVLLGLALRAAIAFVAPWATVSSWWRTVSHNAAVGGQPKSWHLIGLGFDVVPVDAKTKAALAGVFAKVINEGDHLHVQFL